jgi:MFS family permease
MQARTGQPQQVCPAKTRLEIPALYYHDAAYEVRNTPYSSIEDERLTRMPLKSYLDRINVSNARLAGMQNDLHMSDVQWSAGISLFYVGYIISQVPATVIIAKGKPRWLLPGIMLGWSAVTICMAAVSTGWGFMLCRFLVGLTEGPFVPAVSLMTSSWYTKHESPLRMGIWHAGNIVSNIISGLLAAGILTNMDGVADLAAWKWFVLIEGVVSIIVGVSGFFLLPNFPNNTGTYFMTDEESQMAQYRALVSAGGASEDDEGDMWGGVWQACKDPYTWMFASMHFALIIAQSFKDFFPSVSFATVDIIFLELALTILPDRRHSWILQNWHLSHSGTSLCGGLLRYVSGVLVFWPHA